MFQTYNLLSNRPDISVRCSTGGLIMTISCNNHSVSRGLTTTDTAEHNRTTVAFSFEAGEDLD